MNVKLSLAIRRIDEIMFSSLMPERREFFDLLIAHSDRVVAGANATLRLINSLGTSPEEISTLIKEVALNEGSADKIKTELITLLHKSFTTPINRDQIHSLTIDLDKVLHSLRHVANAVTMYNIADSTTEMRELAELASDACMHLNRAVIAISDKGRSQAVTDLCKAIDQIEQDADRLLEQAITRIFKEQGDPMMGIKLKEFYFLQETVIDHCNETAKMIEEILIENS